MPELFTKVAAPTGQVNELLTFLEKVLPAVAILAIIDDGQRIPEDRLTGFPNDLVYKLLDTLRQQTDQTQPAAFVRSALSRLFLAFSENYPDLLDKT